MKHPMIAIALSVSGILLGGDALATVAHPENTDIVSYVFPGSNTVCFNNDGHITDVGECFGTPVDEGLMFVHGSLWRGQLSGINGCGLDPVNPVSSAVCPWTNMDFAFCVNNYYVLVQTIDSGHYWAIKADATCTAVATPETTGLVPCLKTDSFDPETGCTRKPADPNPPVLSIEGGYIKPRAIVVPPIEHCDDQTHVGRMVVDGVNDIIYVCTPTGWSMH